jgi:hypothetical protein
MANKIYQAVEADRTWSDAGTGSDELMDLGGLAADGVVCGSYHDLGAAPRTDLYEVELFIDGFDTAPVVGQMVELWFTQSNGTTEFDGQITTDPTDTVEGDATLAQAQNCTFACAVRVYSTTAGDELKRRRTIRLTGRYVAPIVVNRTDDALLSSSDAHMVTLTPIPQEMQ